MIINIKKMDQYIIINDYIMISNKIKYLEENAYIIFSEENYLKSGNVLTILFTEDKKEYLNYLKNKYNGNIKNCLINNNNILYSYILEIYDIYILEYLSEIYNNKINEKIENKLYNDFIKLYKNQSKLMNIQKNEIFI